MIPHQKSHEPVYKYVCDEGNIGLKRILAGARADDAIMAAGKQFHFRRPERRGAEAARKQAHAAACVAD